MCAGERERFRRLSRSRDKELTHRGTPGGHRSSDDLGLEDGFPGERGVRAQRTVENKSSGTGKSPPDPMPEVVQEIAARAVQRRALPRSQRSSGGALRPAADGISPAFLDQG